ncbi:MAG TPA: hypothetical protein VK213_14360 [Bacteroidales bacterium]|nr:hypothetical protein [Bacteroidales bacterium]
MQGIIDDLLEDFSTLFPNRKFSIAEVEKIYGTHESDDETSFEEYLKLYLNNSVDLFKIHICKSHKKLPDEDRQKAFLMSVLTELISYKEILLSAENQYAKFVLERIENSIVFAHNVFGVQLGLEQQQRNRSEYVSSYFRGIGKLRFSLNKSEVTTLFLVLTETGILDFPVTPSTLATFLENNVQYWDSSSKKHIDMSTCLPTISKLKSGSKESDEIIQKLLKRMNVQITPGI